MRWMVIVGPYFALRQGGEHGMEKHILYDRRQEDICRDARQLVGEKAGRWAEASLQ